MCPTPPSLKLCAERLFDPDAERHLGAWLVQVLERQRFREERRGLAGNK
jgi:hypothetical protein